MARAARSEIEKKEMEKDLEVTGAVQTLLLPRNYTYENRKMKLAGYYEPAARAGGD